MKKLLALAAVIPALFAGRVSAADLTDAKYFTADESSVMIEELSADYRGGTIPGSGPSGAPTIPGPGDLPKPPSGPVINPPLGTPGTTPPATPSDPGSGFQNTVNNVNSAVGMIDNIVNLVDKIWGIIEKNQPVVNINTTYANAVPFGTTHWTQLQQWNKPATKRYAFSMKNGYGSEVVKVIYQVHYTWGGNFQGKGKFLTGVTVEPLSVTTAWGYKVTLTSEVPDSTIANVGTHEDPVASMQLQLRWIVHTAVKDIQDKAIYYVQGDGVMKEIGSPFANGMQTVQQKKLDNAVMKIEGVKFN
ncbi:MAG: hypothetical protein HY952_05170 [Elusimicrobia bacterium]|nr:hypothetical protein [Elusimicrobiota bacterium]